MKRYCLHVAGEFACFTRPEMKVERVSYDVITPSAARAVFDAILWKPEIRWQVRRIEVLAPIRWINLRRNEVGAKVPLRNVQAAMNGSGGILGIDIEDERQQRAGLFLRDVAYRLHADMEVRTDIPNASPPAKYWDMFERRAAKGQCVNQPYLGCREFACSFRPVSEAEAKAPAITENRDLGWMLNDLDFSDPADPKPRFFKAEMSHGIIDVPPLSAEGVRG